MRCNDYIGALVFRSWVRHFLLQMVQREPYSHIQDLGK